MHRGVFSCCPASWEGTQSGEATQAAQRDVSHHMAACLAVTAGGKKEGGGVRSGWWSLSSQGTTMSDGPSSAGSGWHLLAGGKRWLDSFFCSVFAWLLLYQVSCLCLNPWVLALLWFWFSPLTHLGRASKRLHGAKLPVGFKPQQVHVKYNI